MVLGGLGGRFGGAQGVFRSTCFLCFINVNSMMNNDENMYLHGLINNLLSATGIPKRAI